MAEENVPATTFDIRKIYLKDASVESPNSPNIFLNDASKPEISIDATIRSSSLDIDDYYEVVLGLTVTSKIGEDVAFLVEVQQAGIFHIVGIPESDLPLALEIACPNVLLPFAREAIADVVTKAGFPQLLLSPINFEALYQQKHQANQQNSGTDSNESTTH
jgi:preprotein translocase subunit SecB